MARAWLLLLLALELIPARAWGLNLEWAGGMRDVQLTSARRCTLIVTPSAGEAALPIRWRLYWTGSSDVHQPVQFLTQPGPGDALPVCALDPAANSDDVLSNTSTVEFCSNGASASRAAYVLQLDASLHAKFKVVVDEGSLLDQNSLAEVTVNGGAEEDYQAALRLVSSLPDSDGVSRLGVAGQGMDRVQSAWLYPPNAEAPSDALPILTQTAVTLTVALPENASPASTLVLSNGDGEPLNAETLQSILGYDPLAAGASAQLRLPFPQEPKDFAFIYADPHFHIFYTWLDLSKPDSLQSTDFGHAVSQNLYNWTILPLPHVVPTRPGKFDAGHVWAPTIILRDGVYYMYYTGVAKDPNGLDPKQSIGRATSTDLYNWTQEDDPVLECADIPWSYCNDSSQGRQFRDPFVMEDPTDPTHDLMYFATRLGTDIDHQIVGVAHTYNPAGNWLNLQPMLCTNHFITTIPTSESPQVFQHNSLWYLMITDGFSPQPIQFKTAPNPLADSSQWSAAVTLDDEVHDPNIAQYIAAEHLSARGKEYLAVVNRIAVNPRIDIREMAFTTPPHFVLSAPPVTDVPSTASGADLDFRWVSSPGSRAGIALRLDLPEAATGRIEFFDVTGRSVARLCDGWMPAGPSHWTWDGRLSTGGSAGSGIYFARVKTSAASRTIRVALLR
jgi:hypothetical protein